MTRAEEPSTGFERSTFGARGAARMVVVLRSGSTAMVDPDPETTATRDVRVLAIGLTAADLVDPAAFGGETSAESQASALAAVLRQDAQDRPIGVVGYGATGAFAILLAAELGEDVDRLALVAVPTPETPLDRDDAGMVMGRIRAKTLIINGQRDPDAAAGAAQWHHDHLPGSRVEMVPPQAVPSTDGRLALADVWDRVLSHVAPGTKSRRPTS